MIPGPHPYAQARMQSGSGHHGQLDPRVRVTRQVQVTRQGQAGTSVCGVPLLLGLLAGIRGASTHLIPAKSWRKQQFGLMALAWQSSAAALQKNLLPCSFSVSAMQG